MPSEISLYRKIQVVLDVARAVKVNDCLELRAQIMGQRPPNFITKQYDKKHDAFLPDISERGVRRAVAVCRMLQLIDDSGQLDEAGRHALRGSNFSRVLAEQVKAFLEKHGIHFSTLNSIVAKNLRANPMIMPTSIEIWQKCGTTMRLLLFSQMLTLLSQCGSAQSSQRKIYLHFTD